MTNIEWTQFPGTLGKTWNPVFGCEIVSPGCTNCYAMNMAWRLDLMIQGQKRKIDPLNPYKGLTKKVNGKVVWTGEVNFGHGYAAYKPLQWKKPCTVFVNSMADLFHDDVPEWYIDELFAVMAACPQHTFIILTKRSKRMKDYMLATGAGVHIMKIKSSVWRYEANKNPDDEPRRTWPLTNVILGVSAEDPKRANERIPDLLATPAAKRVVSIEPQLEHINLSDEALEQLDWVICGGESGPGARPFKSVWARDLIQWCKDAKLPFFMKQVGSNPHDPWGDTVKLKSKKGGDPDEWHHTLNVRQFPDHYAVKGSEA